MSENIIKTIEEQYPECTNEMMKNYDIAYNIFCKKQADYGPGNIELGLTRTQENQLLAEFGVIVRMNDKMQRLMHLKKKQLKAFYLGITIKPQNESITDSNIDIMNYANIYNVVEAGKWGK